jgi:hypothetical protein
MKTGLKNAEVARQKAENLLDFLQGAPYTGHYIMAGRNSKEIKSKEADKR